MKHFQISKDTTKSSTRIKSAFYSRNKSFANNQLYSDDILSPIKANKKSIIINPNTKSKNFSSFNESSNATNNKIKRDQSHFSFQTNIKKYKNARKNIYLKEKNTQKRPLSFDNAPLIKKKWRFSDEPVWKKFLRGKLLYLLRKNIILCEKKFNPITFTESISNIHLKEFKNKFRNIDNRTKVGIFTNKFPQILDQGNKFYSRYFDHFISPDELLYKNFTKEEIFQIRTDPVYFNLGSNFNNVFFFKKKSLKETLNEEEKLGHNKLFDIAMKKSLKITKKRIQKYMDYYSSIMSRQGMINIVHEEEE